MAWKWGLRWLRASCAQFGVVPAALLSWSGANRRDLLGHKSGIAETLLTMGWYIYIYIYIWNHDYTYLKCKCSSSISLRYAMENLVIHTERLLTVHHKLTGGALEEEEEVERGTLLQILCYHGVASSQSYCDLIVIVSWACGLLQYCSVVLKKSILDQNQ